MAANEKVLNGYKKLRASRLKLMDIQNLISSEIAEINNALSLLDEYIVREKVLEDFKK